MEAKRYLKLFEWYFKIIFFLNSVFFGALAPLFLLFLIMAPMKGIVTFFPIAQALILIFILILIYRKIYKLLEYIHKNGFLIFEVVIKLRHLSILFTVKYAGDCLFALINYFTLKYFSETTPEKITGTIAKSAELISQSQRNNLFFPDFSGITSLLLAVVLFVIAKLLYQHISVHSKVHSLEEEQNLTI